MYDQTMRTVQQSIALFASLLLVLLLLLIDIYDCVGTNDEKIIMFGMLVIDDVNLLVEFAVISVSTAATAATNTITTASLTATSYTIKTVSSTTATATITTASSTTATTLSVA